MRNLKKVLALVLAMAMALSLAVTAGAAFNDQDKIVNEEAVDMCVALNIINGRTNGDFDPAGNVTRAEAAKMICIALNGGKEPVLSASATPVFADIAGHWAAKYIEYCVSEGIVAGKSATSFDPNGNVTGVELAKMLLIALGYNAEHGKFLGANWDTNVNVVASQKDLYAGLESIDPSVALSRDNAAQMIWNALQAEEVYYDYTLVTENGQLVSKVTVRDTGIELMDDKYGTYDDEGIMTGFTYDDEKAEWTYTIACGCVVGQRTVNHTFTTAEDFTALFQQNVKVIAKEVKDEVVVYGIFAEDSSVIAEGVLGDIDAADLGDKSIEIADVDYKTTGTSVASYAFNAAADANAVTSSYTTPAVALAYTMKAIDNTGDDKIDVIVYVPFTVATVDYLGTSTIDTSATTSTDLEDVKLVGEIEEDDYVMIVSNTVDQVPTYTKLDVATGKVAATKNAGADVQIDGTWYTLANGLTSSTVALDYEYDYIAINGYVYVADPAATNINAADYALVTAVQTNKDWNATYPQVSLLTSTGEIVTVEYDNITTDGDAASTGVSVNNVVYIADIDEGVYTLESVSNANKMTDTTLAGDLSYDKETAKASNATASYNIADDAVIYVVDTTETPNTYKVITGADLKKTNDGTLNNTMVKKDSSTGFTSVVFATMASTLASSDDVAYGYVISDVVTTKDGAKTLASFTIWNGTAEVPLTTDGYATVPAKGNVVSYEVTDGKVTTLTVYGATAQAAITAFDGKNIVFDGGTEYVVNADTTIIYIDAADQVKAEGGKIKLAHNNGTDLLPNYVDNAAFVLGTDTEDGKTVVDLLVIDIDGHIDGTTVLN